MYTDGSKTGDSDRAAGIVFVNGKLIHHLMFKLHGHCSNNQAEQTVPTLIRRCDDLPATITHVPVAAVLVLNTPDDGRLRPKHVE